MHNILLLFENYYIIRQLLTNHSYKKQLKSLKKIYKTVYEVLYYSPSLYHIEVEVHRVAITFCI